MLYLTRRVEPPAQTTASVTLPVDMRVKSRIKVTLNDGRQAGLFCHAVCCCAMVIFSVTKTVMNSLR